MAAVIYQEARDCDRRLSQYFNGRVAKFFVNADLRFR